MRGIRRLSSFLLAFLLVPTLLAGAGFAAIGYLGWDCVNTPAKRGYGSSVVGLGSRSQTVIHYRALVNRFSARCRPDAQGIVTVAGDADDVVYRAMLLREADALRHTYHMYGLDRPLTSAEKQQAEQDLGAFLGRVSLILHMPLWIEGLGIGYNLACPTGNPANELRLSSAALSGIFGGVVTSWDHPLIWANNERLQDCDQTVRVAVRSDVTEQTTVFKDYLAKRNSQWSTYKQPHLNRQWPPTLLGPCRGRGDAGIAGCVAGQPASIGYLGYAEAKRQGLALAAVQNSSNGFVVPSVDQFTRAAAIPTYPADSAADWSNASLTDGPVGYPITSLQFALAYRIMANAYPGQVGTTQVRSVIDYLTTALSDETQKRLPRYGLAPLPQSLVEISRNGAKSITYLE